MLFALRLQYLSTQQRIFQDRNVQATIENRNHLHAAHYIIIIQSMQPSGAYRQGSIPPK